GCKSRVKGSTKKGKYTGIEFSLTLDELLSKYYNQNGLCAISGIKMTYILGGGRKNKNISIDRIDSTKGYTNDNTQLVCSQVNMMKGDMTTEDLIYFCKEIINNQHHECRKVS